MYNWLLRICLILTYCILTWSCDPGQFNDNGSCLSCVSNCLSCSNNSTCDTCKPGHYNVGGMCDPCQIGCQTCSLTSCLCPPPYIQKNCSVCFPGYFKSGVNCSVCPTYCATCTSNSVCQSCRDHYILIGNSCSVCDTSCKNCQTTLTTCTSCDPGKYLNGSSCLPCSSPCSECINSSTSCTVCIGSNSTAVNYKCVCDDGYYSDESDQCSSCLAPCSKCENTEYNCTDCVSTFTLSSIQHYQCVCSFGYFQVDSITCNKCISPCLTCEYNQNHCLTCLDPNQTVNSIYECICNQGWILSIDGITCIQCQQPCLTCVDTINKCTECKDQLHQLLETCECQPGWINDINYFCIPCSQPCKTCQHFTFQCLSCLDINHELNNLSQCVCKSSYYPDTLRTCAKCSESCKECDQNGCISCISVDQILDTNNNCVCSPGFVLDGTQCILSLCGDLKVTLDEECDDGNMIPYDGCYECKFSCSYQCFDCINGVCYGCFDTGWILNKINICTPLCGDGIVIEEYEQCDDGNDIPYDGCYQCQFECQEGCIQCQSNQCQKCHPLYVLDIKTGNCLKQNNDNDDQLEQMINFRCGENHILINNMCVHKCGNGLRDSQYEECDDGNLNGGDGCSSFCLIESSYQCINQENSLSLCTYIKAPQMNLNVLTNNGDSLQVVELTFTQQVQVEEAVNFEDIIAFTITPQTQYKLTIDYISNITIQLSNSKYQIQIEFIEPVKNPILEVVMQKNTIYNSLKLGLNENEKKINLGAPFVLPETTKKQLSRVVQLNDAMIYSMAGVSSLALVTRNAIVFFNLLDLLQSFSYLRFLKSQFPPNFRDFLNTFTKISLQPILNYLKVDQLLEDLNGKNKSDQVNSNLQPDYEIILNKPYLFNAKSCYFSVLASILTYLLYCALVSNTLINFIFKWFQNYPQNSKAIKLIYLFQKYIQKKFQKLKIEYFSFGIFQVYQAILHQLTFSVLLQFPSYTFDSPFAIFNSVNAILGLGFIIIANFPLLSITTIKIKNYRKWKYFYSESKTQFWAGQFKSFQIYKILFYIFIITKLINYPEAQSILLSMQSLFFLIYIIRFKPLKSVFELTKLVCKEFVFMIISGTFLLYSFEFSQETFILIGWIHISLFCAIMASNLFIDILQQIKKKYETQLLKKQKAGSELESQLKLCNVQGFALNGYDQQIQK
ncbi:unnamed protein product [Paramecium octaurelia]|uniref:TNFR-Cys domain-containing protein n=1 Tax=Paramecium octaurelia TaxID=43137 RepID=A0A8S1UN59_PAROT|nr:unnamed protein product [Paramecium octaurelia]